MNAFCRDALPSGRTTNTSTAVDRPTSTDCGLAGRVRPQIAFVKLRAWRAGTAIASKKLWS